MDSDIKKELIANIKQLTIKQERSLEMPSRIVSAVLKIPSVHTVDITDDAVEVSNSQGEPVDDFEHGLVKHYSTQTIYSRNLITLHDVRRKGLNEEAEEMELASYDLVLTFNDLDEAHNFLTELAAAGYTKRPTQQPG